ncbi:hypothetical protein ASPWEDRAFT_68137 [Aspergillus wentii DTO 134E9]|uniref:Uncharacterized protein n=1 Tax=Aspergillus wentii DTO 134E9 TaxID=1073089 RepID=A0A1L9RIH4_ASPWE|nr:uncharacterized protein ASPWEDRAFT_68137 [Aspergillus wentii DTO 134E9]KAI9932361.1 hypothetical protein MW887_009874 [Aspergillus wentii]OJJ34673.1 hypothetical protein ASPWEDRAFT_68137 [Aspergillus wentii DTO 134E9]
MKSFTFQQSPLLSEGSSTNSISDGKQKIITHKKKKLYWTYETLALIGAFAAFIVQIALLRHYEGLPQNTWPYHTITLNGMIAILSTITRSMLMFVVAAGLSQGKWLHFAQGTKRRLRDFEMFDQASRGIWGSLRLLCQTMPVHPTSIGALLIIVGIGMDTFSQQLLSIQSRTVGDASPDAKYPRSQYYNGSAPRAINVQNMDYPMLSAIYRGMYGAKFTDLNAPCKTGNCTWPILPSLAVCGGCTDWSDMMEFKDDDLYSGVYTLPDGFTYSSKTRADGTQITGRAAPISSNSTYNNYTYSSTTYPNGTSSRLLLSHFEVAGFGEAITYPNGSAYMPLGGWECALWFCIQAYNVTTSNGVQHREIVDTWSEYAPRNQYGVNFTSPPPSFNVAPGSFFGIENYTLHDARSTANRIFNGTNKALNPAGEGSQIDTMMQNIRDMHPWIKSISESMSQALQQSYPVDNSTDDYYAGTVYHDQIYIHVRWGWITFPAVILVLTTVYFILIAHQTRNSPVGAWKDSLMAVMGVKLDRHLRADVAVKQDIDDLDQVLKDEQVDLRNEGVWEWKR